jgi:RNA polymerase sigma-54 factor
MFQVQEQSLRPLTTAHLAQTMSLLVLSNQELQERVDAELASNPALELLNERRCPSCQRPLVDGRVCPICSLKQQDSLEPIVFLSPRDSYRRSRKRRIEDTPIDLEPAAPENLALQVLEQLAADLQPHERKIAAYILASLDEDGFLTSQPGFIAQTNGVPLANVKRVLDLISHVDPPGLATHGPREALLAQLDQYDDRLPTVALAKRILGEVFRELGQRDFEAIAKKLDTKIHKVRQTATFIQENLNPYPARAFWGSGRQPQRGDPNVYYTPDIKITRNPAEPEGSLLVEIFTPVSGFLRVNPLLKKALRKAHSDHSSELNEQLKKAILFVKCLKQRNNTMRRLMEILVSLQRKFILEGDRYLKPMTRAALSEEIGVHESTVSRAVSHKSVQLPDGRIIPLSRFFDRSLSVRDRIKEIIENEKEPLTDGKISAILEKKGIKVARRTVAKYRNIEGILPSRLRGQKKKPAMSRV